MIFASDLDRTLIYSKKFIKGLKNIQLVEKKEDEEISFMTHAAIEKLEKIAKEMLFIPVTTRTIEQYKRIHIMDQIHPKYAIVSNGGNILVNGKIDEEWKIHIHHEIKTHTLPYEEVMKKFEEIESKDWVLRKRRADDLFTYCIVDQQKIPTDELNSFVDWLKERKWKGSLQGRKLYFVPQCVCKYEAVRYIQQKEGKQIMVAAGDSLLDYPMLSQADYAIALRHGELYKVKGYDLKNISFTQSEGIQASEELLDKVDQFFKRRL